MTTGGTDGDGPPRLRRRSGTDALRPGHLPARLKHRPSASIRRVNQSSPGGSLTFTASADITTPTIQWQASVNGGSNWINLSGATNPTLTIGPLNAFENGWEVRAVFTNYVGPATTDPATITVTAPTTTVVLPSNAATLSGTQYPRRHRLPGRDQVQYELTGGSLNDTVIATATPTIYGWLATWNTTNGAERDVHPAERRFLGRAHRHQSRHHHHRQQSATDDHRRAAVERRHAVGRPVPRRHRVPRRDQGPVRADRREPERRRDRHRHARPSTDGWRPGTPPTVPNGTYTLQSVASYAGGVSGTSPGITVTVSN